MRYLQFRATPPEPKAVKPWHPETIEDIKQVDLEELPTVNGLGKVGWPNKEGKIYGWVPTGSWIAGGVNFVRSEMEETFTRNPSVGFAVEGGSVYVYEYLAKELKGEVRV